MDINPLDILKWVGIAFAAGFIGYFGRYFGMLIIERMRKRKPQQAIAVESAKEIATGQDNKLEDSRVKLEKKRAKAEAKKAKKDQKK